MKNLVISAVSVFVVLLIIAACLGISVQALFLTIFGLAALAYVSWNFFNSEHDWFSVTMCTGFGFCIWYGFYCVLSVTGNMPWFYALCAGMFISALLGCIYRKLHYR